MHYAMVKIIVQYNFVYEETKKLRVVSGQKNVKLTYRLKGGKTIMIL